MTPNKIPPIILVLFLLSLTNLANAKTVVIFPVNDTLTTQRGGTVSGYTDTPEATTISIILNDKKYAADVWDGAFYLDLDWAEGENKLMVETTTITFKMDEYAEKPKEPSVHEAIFQSCFNCHVYKDGKLLKKTDDQKKLCLGCHKEVKFKHGKAQCLDCHLSHTSWEPKLLKIPKENLCGECHKRLPPEEDKDVHKVVFDKTACITCHARVHVPSVDPKLKLCGDCHQKTLSANKKHDKNLEGDCKLCHTVHPNKEGNHQNSIENSCFGCHEPSNFAPHVKALAKCTECHGIHQAPKSKKVDSDYCGSCHPKAVNKKLMHGPEATGNCFICHPVHDLENPSPARFSCMQCHGMDNVSGGHTGTVVGFGTCSICHKLHSSDQKMFLPEFQHEPFKKGDCTICHSKKGFGVDRKFKGDFSTLCLECHNDFKAKAKHKPVVEGKCILCHVPHAGDAKNLLQKKPEKLCVSCHDKIKAVWNDGSKHANSGGCLLCHEPHGKGGDKNLRDKVKNGCLSCHPSPITGFGGVVQPKVHGPVNTGKCTACHDWHADKNGFALSAPMDELCVSCHEDVDVKPVKDNFMHEPVARGECSKCHNPHAAEDSKFLRVKSNGLCAKCHDKGNHAAHPITALPRLEGIKVPKDWPRSGNSLACLGCHFGHQGKFKGLLVMERSTLCAECHK